MKNLFRLTVIILSACFSSQHLYAQNPTIVGLKHNSDDYFDVVAFDCITHVETVIDSTSNFRCTNSYHTIDPYNGRYFFAGWKPGLSFYRIFTIDLTNQTVSYSQQFSQSELGNIEYDMFNNRLIYVSNEILRSYNLATGEIDTLCTNAFPMHGHSCNMQVFNSNDQQYFYISDISDTQDQYTIIDAITGTLVDTTIVNIPPGAPSFIVYDINTMKYFGMADNATVVTFDPLTGIVTPIVTINDWNGQYYSEQHVFDSNTGLYYMPYINDLGGHKLVSVDVYSGNTIDTVDYPQLEINALYARYIPSIRNDNDTLMATYGNTYQWYYNDAIISGANSQKYVATQGGLYKVEVTFFNGRTDFSEEVNVSLTSIKDVIPYQSIIYPNPNEGVFSIETQMTKGFYQIFDINGKTLLKGKVNTTKFTIDISAFSKGIYFISVTDGERRMFGKVVKE